MSRASISSSAQEKEEVASRVDSEPVQEKGDLALTKSNASEQYPSMRRVVPVMIALYLAMFLVALVCPPYLRKANKY
jgi:hypothetical protein